MLRHVVLFTWAEGTTQEQKEAIAEALRALPPVITAIRDYRVGPDAGLSPANHDFAVVADFDDADGYLTYRDHPAHRAVVEQHVSPAVSGRASVQFEI